MPNTKDEAKVVERTIGGTERALSLLADIKIRVGYIFPDEKAAEDRRERTESTGLAQALILLDDLTEDLRDLKSHLDLIV